MIKSTEVVKPLSSIIGNKDVTTPGIIRMTQKQELVETYRWLRQYGLNDSHSGNASIRNGDAVWVTPTGACADTLTEADLVACSIDGFVGEKASLDAPLHIAVYRSNPDARCVLHSHGPNTVAITMDGKDFVPPDFEGAYYFQRVPVLNIPYQDYLDESPGQVSRSLARHRITVVRGHGVYACAETINLAYKWTSSLELSANTAFIAKLSGTIPN
ncbi:MAG: class II aldolase/adducin family protein [Acidiferrobacterales bacterium]